MRWEKFVIKSESWQILLYNILNVETYSKPGFDRHGSKPPGDPGNAPQNVRGYVPTFWLEHSWFIGVARIFSGKISGGSQWIESYWVRYLRVSAPKFFSIKWHLQRVSPGLTIKILRVLPPLSKSAPADSSGCPPVSPPVPEVSYLFPGNVKPCSKLVICSIRGNIVSPDWNLFSHGDVTNVLKHYAINISSYLAT